MKPILAGLATFAVVFALMAWGARLHPLLAAATAIMVAVAVGVTIVCGQLPQALPRAIDWYWFGAFGLAWFLGTLGLTAIDGLTSRGRVEAEVLVLAASVMGYSIGHLAGLRRARPRPADGHDAMVAGGPGGGDAS